MLALTAPKEKMLSAATVELLRMTFRKCFEIDLPEEFLCAGLQSAAEGPLLSNEPQNLSRLLIGPVNRFPMEFPVSIGHHTVGFWGHGVNTYAFYLIFRHANECVYLRLHTGGAYSDPVKKAADITNYVMAFSQLLRAARHMTGQLIVIESMGSAFYRYAAEGMLSELRDSLLGSPQVVGELLALLDRQASVIRNTNSSVNVVTRDSALRIAGQIYDAEMRRAGNQRVGMRAMGAAKDNIHSIQCTMTSREFRHEMLLVLGALKEQYQDADGDHVHARACILQLIDRIRLEVLQT